VTFTVSDGVLEDFETVTITVAEINAAPVLAAIGDQAVIRGRSLTLVASATDPDLPANSLTFSLDPASTDLGMTIASATGEFRWTPSEAHGPGSYAVTIRVTDSGNPPQTDTAVFTITVLWWQNPAHFADVNGDGDVTPDDVLLLVNDINAHDSRNLLTASPPTPPSPPFLDPSGDGVLSPLDALLVISYINGQAAGSPTSWSGGEGEYALPLGGEVSAEQGSPLVVQTAASARQVGSCVTLPGAACAKHLPRQTSSPRASSAQARDFVFRLACDESPEDGFETRELGEALSELAVSRR